MKILPEPGNQLDQLIGKAYLLQEKRREAALREKLDADRKSKNG